MGGKKRRAKTRPKRRHGGWRPGAGRPPLGLKDPTDKVSLEKTIMRAAEAVLEIEIAQAQGILSPKCAAAKPEAGRARREILTRALTAIYPRWWPRPGPPTGWPASRRRFG